MDIQKIRNLLKEHPRSLSVHFFERKEDRRSEILFTLFRELQDIEGMGSQDPPRRYEEEAPYLAFAGKGTIRHFYKALPQGPEWPPFWSLLHNLVQIRSSLAPQTEEIIRGLKTPLTIRVLINLSCPFCAKTVDLVNRIALAGDLIQTWIIDLGLFPEYLERYRPKAAPTTIIENEVHLTGEVDEKELAEWLKSWDTEDYLQRLYRQDLQEKRLEKAWERLLARPQDIPAVVSLIRDEVFAVKLGAMALLEQVPETADHLESLLWEALNPLLRDPSEQVVGDAAYLLGLLHDKRKIPLLQALLSHSNPEIVEIAREGLPA